MSSNITLNISRRAAIRGTLAVIMIAYLIVATVLTRQAVNAAEVKTISIVINDSLGTNFINAQDIKNAVPVISAKNVKRASLNTLAIEQTLRQLASVENVKCIFLNDQSLRITVTPMIPVARVFPDTGVSYYINREGKKIPADIAHHVNVPVVTGNITNPAQVVDMLPMLEKISKSPRLDALVTSVSRSKQGDIIIIPAVAGHVINVGDTTDMDNKFQRLSTFYDKVMKIKGWNYYDTISVKWRGRVIATRRSHPIQAQPEVLELEEQVDDATMLTGTDDVVAEAPAAVENQQNNKSDNKPQGPQ